MQNKAKIGGILSIISGSFGILGMIFFIGIVLFLNIMFSSLASSVPSGEEIPVEVIAFMWIIYGGMGLVLGLIGIFAIIGGVFALKRKNWGLALAGSIAGTITFLPVGVPAVIYISMAQPEFAATGAAPPPSAVTESSGMMQTRAKVSGILSIVSGGVGIISMGYLFLINLFSNRMYSSMFSSFPPGTTPPAEFNEFFNQFSGGMGLFYGGMGVAIGLVGIVAVIGGIFALKRQRWGLALAGAIAGAVTFFPTGIPALMYVVTAQPEFKAGSVASVTAPPPAA